MIFKIVRDLPDHILLAHGAFQPAELIHSIVFLCFDLRKIVVDTLADPRRVFVLIQCRELLGAELSPIQGDDQSFLYAAFFDMISSNI